MFEGISIFDSLTSEELNNLSLFCQERFLKKGEILFKEGDDAVAMYILKNGKLKAYKERSDGEILLGFVEGSGDMVGEMAIFEAIENNSNIPKKRMASIKAEENSFLIVIMNYSILELSKKNSGIYGKIVKIIEERKEKNAKN
ncbi:cyclic nucleotide-binding domain-containing protein [Candidatus Gracilibacteria bacterium]|nr:cyclic nucleotide-binding domain-containing protein [Candidatus Gracilibacteria bacterium]